MKAWKYSLFVPLIAGLSLNGAAQSKKDAQLVKQPWYLTSIIPLTDSTGVGVTNEADKKFGLAFINASGITEKEVPLPGRILGIGKSNGKVVAFYTLEKDRAVIKAVHGVLADLRSKTILLDKVVYENPGDNQISTYAQNDPGGNFKNLLIRETALAGKEKTSYWRPNASYAENKRMLVASTSLSQILLTDKLEASAHPMTSAAIGGSFISAQTNIRGETFILSYADDQLVAEKFGPDGLLQNKLTSPLEITSKYPYQQVTQLDTPSGNALIMAIRCLDKKEKPTFTMIRFDFAGTKVLSTGSQLLNKDYSRVLKSDPGFQKITFFSKIEDLTPIGIILMGDKLIVWKDIKGDYDHPAGMFFTNAGSIISIYDNKLQLLHNIFLDKFYAFGENYGRDLSFHVRDGKLIALGNEEDNVRGKAFADVLYTLDLDKLTVGKQKIEDLGNHYNRVPIDPSTIFWFRNKIVLSQLWGGWFPPTVYCRLQSLDYPGMTANQALVGPKN